MPGYNNRNAQDAPEFRNVPIVPNGMERQTTPRKEVRDSWQNIE
jgi:hypothetical protein